MPTSLVCKLQSRTAVWKARGTGVGVSPHIMNPRHRIRSILALDDGLLVFSVPVLKLSVELQRDDLHVAWIVVPGEVAVDADHIHKWSLETQQHMLESRQAC